MKKEEQLIEFEKLIDSIGANRDEAFKKLLMLYAKKHETFIDAITKFIKSNNTSFTHLWEDSDEGDVSYDSYELLYNYIIDEFA